MKGKGLNLNLSSRDKMLLWIVASVAVIVAAYFLGYTKLMEQVSTIEAKLSSAQSKYRELYDKNQNKDEYLANTAINKNRFNQVLSGYENGASQENSLMFLRDIEKTTGGWIKSTTFATTSPIYSFGAMASSNPEAQGQLAYQSDMVGYKTTLTLAYEAEYEEFKSLLTYINNYYSKNSIDSISMAYKEDTSIVSGTMTVSTYCITGSNRTFTNPSVDVPTGTDNLFYSSTFFPTVIAKDDKEGNYILSDYDYYVLLNASSSDMNACTVGQKGDRTGDTVLSSDANAQQKLVIKLSGSSGNYKISYTLGSLSYPAANAGSGASFTAGETLDLLIMSSARKSSADKSGVDLTVVNETDMDLNIKIVDDDVASPRVNIVERTGIINVFR